MTKTMTADGVAHFTIKEQVLLSEALQDELDLKYSDFHFFLKIGAIYVDNKRQIRDGWLATGSLIRVHTKPRRYDCNYDWPSLVVFQNDSFLVLNKPAGVPSHATVDNSLQNSLDQTCILLQIPLYVTHRLDTMTSGLIVYAKKRSFVKEFNIMMMERKIEKKYVALVETSQPIPKELVHYMEPKNGTPKKLSAVPVDGWDICKLEVFDQEIQAPKLSKIKINLLTGRTHQIRSQLSFLNAPIQGDTLYGAIQPFKKNAIALKSFEIAFDYNREKVKFNLDLNFEDLPRYEI